MRNSSNGRRSSEMQRPRKSGQNIMVTLEQKLADHPQVAAVVFDGLILACERASELLLKVQDQLREKVDEIRGSSAPRARGQRSEESPA